MDPALWNLTLYADRDFDYALTVENKVTGAPVDLSTFTFSGAIHEPGGTEALAEITATVDDGSNGALTLHVARTEAAKLLDHAKRGDVLAWYLDGNDGQTLSPWFTGRVEVLYLPPLPVPET